MRRQEGCWGPTPERATILDRLEGLSKVIHPDVFEQARSETGRGKQPACRLSHRVMLWVVLARGLLTHLPIRQVFKHGHFVVRALMPEAAREENLDADRRSFTGCLRILQARLPECDGSTPPRLEQWYGLLLEERAQERIEPRRNRVNPRVVKRKMSKFAKKRPHHRGQPPLKKTFAETVVIT
jgi:hypothetical protein